MKIRKENNEYIIKCDEFELNLIEESLYECKNKKSMFDQLPYSDMLLEIWLLLNSIDNEDLDGQMSMFDEKGE